MQPEVEKFLKYATPRINYIYDQDFDSMVKEAAPLWWLKTLAKGRRFLGLGRRARPIAPNKGLQETAASVKEWAAVRHNANVASLQRRAQELAAAGKAPSAFGAAGKSLGLNFLHSLYDWTVDMPSNLMKTLGRWMGANGKIVDGQFIRGAASRTDNLGSKLYDAGDWFRNKLFGGAKLDSALRASKKNMILAGIDPSNAKLIDRVGRIGSGAAVIGLPIAGAFLPEDHPVTQAGNILSMPFEYASLPGWAFKGLEWGMGKMKQTAFDSAAQAAYQTQDQILKGLQNSGRLGHLGGLLSPEFYANQARQKIMPAMQKAFADQAQGLGVNNTFDQLVKHYQNNVPQA